MNTIVVDGNYFDGKSSISRLVTIILYEDSGEIRFQTSDGLSYAWKANEIKFEKFGNIIEIRNNQQVGALLKVDDENFIDKFYSSMKQQNRVDIHTRLVNIGFSKILVIAISIFVLMIALYFYAIPPLAEKSVAFMPESFDNEVGDIFMESFIDENKVDSTKTAHLEHFAKELNFKNTKPLHFLVVDSDEVNAFAAPNGQIVVFKGLLEKVESPEALVALLGHEAGHVNKRHSLKSLSRSLSGYILISLIFSDVNGIMAVIIDNAHQLQTLSYSREFENEADEQGLAILAENHMNLNGMMQLFETLEKEEEFVLPEILSTHPLTKERIKNVEKKISGNEFQIEPNEKLESLFKKLKQ